MKKLSDERFEQMLSAYCEADPQQTFTFHPEEKRKKIIPFASVNRVAAAAASLVLVSVLSLTVYFLFGNNNSTPFAVAPSPQSVTTPSTPTGESDSDQIQDTPEPTQPKSLWQDIVDFLFPQPTENSISINNRTSPTENNRKPTTSFATEAVRPKPTQKTGEKATENPVVQPTEPQPIRPTEILPEPTVPCDPPSNDPTEGSPYPGDPEPTDPPYDDDPWYIAPTEGGAMSGAPVEIFVRVKSDLMEGVTAVYCKVYSQYGFIGSSNLYDYSHQAEILDTASQYTEVFYEVPDGLINRPGFYTFVFYDQNGNELAQWQDYCG